MTTRDEEMSDEERKNAERVSRGLQVMREMGLLGGLRSEQDNDKITDKTPTREIMQSERLQAFLDSFLKWVLVPMGKILKSIIAALWTIFAPLAFTLGFLAIVIMVIMAWSFVAYQIAWWVADETTSRVLLLIFLALAPVVAFANKNAWMWLTPGRQAQAEYTADLLAKALKDKKDE